MFYFLVGDALNKITKENLFRDRFVLGESWNKTYGRYFSDKKVLDSFVNVFLKLDLPNRINVLYPCSGNGLLGEFVCEKLKVKGYKIGLTLVDASKEHLDQNKNKETKKICKDVLEFKTKTRYNLIIMRSSLDYFYKKSLQVKVLRKIKSLLTKQGFFVNQCASMPTIKERDLADKIYVSNNKIGRRHFQGSDVYKIYKKAGFKSCKLVKEAPIMIITEKEHIERYKFSKDEVAKVKKIIYAAKEFKHPNIKNTKKGYIMKFHFPIYFATC